jgi:hypothetical protein
MDETHWEAYGTGNYEKCADCMVHCGYEGTAVADTLKHPLKALKVWLGGIDTEAPLAPEIPLDQQRPADFIFDQLVAGAVSDPQRPDHAEAPGPQSRSAAE